MRPYPCFIGLRGMYFNLDKSITFYTKGNLPGGLRTHWPPGQRGGGGAAAGFNPLEISLPVHGPQRPAPAKGVGAGVILTSSLCLVTDSLRQSWERLTGKDPGRFKPQPHPRMTFEQGPRSPKPAASVTQSMSLLHGFVRGLQTKNQKYWGQWLVTVTLPKGSMIAIVARISR